MRVSPQERSGPHARTVSRARAFAAVLLFVFFLTAQTDSSDTPGRAAQAPPYPGMSLQQEQLADSVVYFIHAFSWKQAERFGRKLNRLERQEDLPPLSRLLLTSARILRIQNGEYESEREKERLIREAEGLAKEGIRQCDDRARISDSVHVTYDLIKGGILGYTATLKIDRSPFEALVDGLRGLRILEDVIADRPDIRDAYMGPGLFHCTLAKAPAVLGKALRLFNRGASLDSGLQYLRLSAHEGKYTRTVSKLYLIQFLSPYYGHLAEEKAGIFASLQEEYPVNAYYAFLELDEELCFHPDSFYHGGRSAARGVRRAEFATHNFSLRRYAELVEWQHWMLSQSGAGSLVSSERVLREFAYYPAFLVAVKLLRAASAPLDGEAKLLDELGELGDQFGRRAERALKASSMNLARRGYYEWHVRDGLKTARGTQE
ncbi:MAG: hypothetical protein GF418_06750 [Chitinivibrionales bacterium]|nr:hypothetical protein [Chitinivibrionales bacterium]MBD3395310.1 hypothetical protein [Chitinivibrionales bacterium]